MLGPGSFVYFCGSVVPKSRLTTGRQQLQLCNELPEEIRLARSVTAFKSLLKTHFYRNAFTIDFLLISKTPLNKLLINQLNENASQI